MGLELVGRLLDRELTLVKETRRSADSTWRPVCGERETVRDRYNELAVDLRENKGSRAVLRLTFRAYDAGVAFSYAVLAPDGAQEIRIVAEKTQFSFPGDATVWAVYSAQGNYDGSEMPLSKLKPGVERPLTVRIADDLYASITEARLVDYARMKLRPVQGRPTRWRLFSTRSGASTAR